MGPLKLIEDLPDDFLVMNGDVLTDLDFSSFYNFHVENKNLFTISSFKREHKVDYGVLEIDQQNKLIDFKEKPSLFYNVSMGVYMVNSKILNYIPKDIEYGFDKLMIELIHANNPANVKIFNGYWLDIGRPDDYEKACSDYENKLFQV